MNGSSPEALLAEYAAAAHAKDVSSFIALYDDEVRVFDLWGSWVYEGAAAWRAAVEEWFSSLGNETVEVRFTDVETTGSGGFAAVSAIVTYAGIGPAGNILRAMQNRLSWVLAHDAGRWRILHEHTSAPVDGESMKVILNRE